MHDVIVIGDDLSSHVAAAACANCGLNTALIAECGLGGLFLVDDYAFNIDPLPLSGFGYNQKCFLIFEELGIQDIQKEALLLNPAYQIILPEHRIDFFSEKEALLNELSREFPDQSGEISNFYESAIELSAIFGKWLDSHPTIRPRRPKDFLEYVKLLPNFIKHKIEINKLKNSLKNDAALNKVFEAQEILLSFTANSLKYFSSHYQNCTPLRGVFSFRQGKQFLFNSLINKLETKGGFYLPGCKVNNIKIGKTIEFEIIGRDKDQYKLSSKFLIVSTKWRGLDNLSASKKFLNLESRLNPVRITYLPFSIHLGCKARCFPEKMARHLAVVPEVDKKLLDSNLIILESNIAPDENASASDKTALTVTTFLPSRSELWSKNNLSIVSSSVIERLEYFLPFLKDNIDYFDLEKSISISEMSHSVIVPRYHISNFFFRGFAARSISSRFKNIFFTGASLLSDAGYEGEIISGINSAARILEK